MSAPVPVPAASAAPFRRPWREWLALFVVLVLVAFAFQGSRGLFEPDEGRYTAVALQMLRSGNWLLPQLNDVQLHVTKPPLTYWAIAGSVALFGWTEWAVRLPYALAFVVTGFAVLAIARRAMPQRPVLAVLVWAGSLYPLLAFNVVSTDALLTMWEACAVACYLQLRPDAPRAGYWAAGAAACLGLAFLTKGPPALIPLIPVIVARGAHRERLGLRALLRPLPLLVFLVAGLAWYVVAIAREPALLPYFVGHEVVGRIFTGRHNRNAEWYGFVVVYLPVLVLAVLPWLLLRGKAWTQKAASLRRPPAIARLRREPVRLFLVLWLVIGLAVFCFARSRLPLYLLPLSVPLSVLIAIDLAPRFDGDRRMAWCAALALWLLGGVALKGTVAYWQDARDDRRLAATLRPHLEMTRPSAVVFVDAPAAYGLSFYLRRPVEALQDGGAWARDSDFHALMPVCDRLELTGRARIDSALVLQREHDLDLLSCTGWVFTPQGQLGRWRITDATRLIP